MSFLLLIVLCLSCPTSILSNRLRTVEKNKVSVSVDIDTESIVNYLTSNVDWIKNNAEMHINSLRDSQGRVGPITMPNILLGDIVGDMELHKEAPSKVQVTFKLAVVDPTAGSEASEQNKAPETLIEVVVPVDVAADMSMMINTQGLMVTSAFYEDKPISLIEMDSGAQDAPRVLEDKNAAQEVIDRAVEHVNKWRLEKCPDGPLANVEACQPLENAVVLGWVVDAGPGQQSLVVAAECGGMKFVAGIDVPRGGKVTTGMFGGTISCLFIY